MSQFKKYSTQRNLPSELARKIKSFYEHQWQVLGGIEEQQVNEKQVYNNILSLSLN